MTRFALVLVCGFTALLALATVAQQLPNPEARVPLGSDAVVLEPAGTTIMFYATAECEECARARMVPASEKPETGPRNQPYPQEVIFRVTGEVEPKPPENTPPLRVESDVAANEFLLKLKFRVRVVDGLNVRYVEPSEVRQIGMPAEVDYHERIYSLPFKLGQVDGKARVALDILGPDGSRVTKFYFVIY